jgi:hypothetical protein
MSEENSASKSLKTFSINMSVDDVESACADCEVAVALADVVAAIQTLTPLSLTCCYTITVELNTLEHSSLKQVTVRGHC